MIVAKTEPSPLSVLHEYSTMAFYMRSKGKVCLSTLYKILDYYPLREIQNILLLVDCAS